MIKYFVSVTLVMCQNVSCLCYQTNFPTGKNNVCIHLRYKQHFRHTVNEFTVSVTGPEKGNDWLHGHGLQSRPTGHAHLSDSSKMDGELLVNKIDVEGKA